MEPDGFVSARKRMVEWQIERRGVFDPAVLEAMQAVPRHLFVPPEYREDAYSDYPLPIGFDQTISQPYIVALMSSLLELHPGEKVLEVGAGSGYQAAVLSKLAGHVFALELIPDLVERARLVLERCAIQNVTLLCLDGSRGYPPEAPFDAILVAACAPCVPEPLLEQLKTGGRLVLPVGDQTNQVLQIWRKDESGNLTTTDHIPVAFVPLRGEWGFKS